MKRDIFAELVEGFEALALHRARKRVLRTHKVLRGDLTGAFSRHRCAVSAEELAGKPAPTPTAHGLVKMDIGQNGCAGAFVW